jgi:ribosomal protein L21
MYAVIKAGGKQYKVSQVMVRVEKLEQGGRKYRRV